MALRPFAAAALVATSLGCGDRLDITIASPEDGTRATRGGIAVNGSTSGGARIVLVNGQPADSVDGFRSWSTAVWLELGDNDITAIAYDDAGRFARSTVRVSLPGTFDATVNNQFQAAYFSSFRGDVQPADPDEVRLSIVGPESRWRLSGPPWARFSQYSGEGPAVVTVTADATGLDYGTFQDRLAVTDDASGQLRAWMIRIDVEAAALASSWSTPYFAVDNSTPLSGYSATLSIADQIGGVAPSESVPWTVSSVSVPWLRVTPSSGGTSPTAQVSMSLDPNILVTMAPGRYPASFSLDWHNALVANQTRTISTRVDLNLRLPIADFVGPYLGVAGRPSPLYLRGRNLEGLGGAVTAYVGGNDVPGLVPDSDTQIRLSAPALAAGRYPVGVRNAPGLPLSSAELVVLPPLGSGYQSIPAPSGRKRLLWDAERQTLYGVNPTDQAIERYRYAAGTWITDPVFLLPQLQDADLSTNGRALVLLSTTGIHDVDLAANPWIATRRMMWAPGPSCGEYPVQLAMTNDGHALILSRLSACSGGSTSYRYGVFNHTIAAIPAAPLLSNGISAASADGSRIYACDQDGDQVHVFDTLTGTFTGVLGGAPPPLALSASGDGSRVLLAWTHVYSRGLTHLGDLGSPNVGAVASRGGTRAFVYRDDNAQPRLVVYDVTIPPATGMTFPVARTIDLPDSPGAPVAMATSHDDSVVFISGNSKILVVPVN